MWRITLALLTVLPGSAGMACAADPTAPVSSLPCDVESVHDGDTLTVTVRCPLLGVISPGRSIRAFGFDAWEVTRTRQTVQVSDEEIVKGKLARDELTDLLKAGQLYAESSGQTDPYGRLSAILWVRLVNGEWLDVAAWMEARGHLRTPRKSGNNRR